MIPWHLTAKALAQLMVWFFIGFVTVGLASGLVAWLWLKERGGYWDSGATGPGDYGENAAQDERLRRKRKEMDGWR